MAATAASAEHGQETRISVTLAGDQENTWFGSSYTRGDIEDDQAGYGICRPGAIEALCAAWQVTIIDPEWGRNDVLWPVLESFAAQH